MRGVGYLLRTINNPKSIRGENAGQTIDTGNTIPVLNSYTATHTLTPRKAFINIDEGIAVKVNIDGSIDRRANISIKMNSTPVWVENINQVTTGGGTGVGSTIRTLYFPCALLAALGISDVTSVGVTYNNDDGGSSHTVDFQIDVFIIPSHSHDQ